MRREINEIPAVVQRQIDDALEDYIALGRQIMAAPPPFVMTAARGSSDCAALFFKYLCEVYTGIPVVSIGPSVASIYHADLRLSNAVCLSISQSGQSPDLLALQDAAKKGGAYTVTLVNDQTAPLARAADEVLAMQAGSEHAIAATKTLVTSLVACAAIVGAMREDESLIDGLRGLPDVLANAIQSDWRHGLADMAPVRKASAPRSLFILSRGPGMAIATEAALKIKELCAIPAHAYSAAEMQHGPLALAGPPLRALCFVPDDAGADSVQNAAAMLQEAGAQVVRIGVGQTIALPPCDPPLLTPIMQITAFYHFIEQLSQVLGRNTDQPAHLRKITQTL